MSETIEVINPFTGQTDRTYPLLGQDEAFEMAQKAKSAQAAWKQESLENRIKWVKEALGYFEKNRDEIAQDISKQMGRPAHQAKGEIGGLLERGNYMAEIATHALEPDPVEPKEGFQRRITHSPYGVIFVISAWNYPLLITINSVVPALISGNTVLLKHSSQTPEIGKHFERAFGTLGSHSHLLQSMVLDHALTGSLIESGKIDHVVFTGSVSGGKKILHHCAESLIAPNLELGGKDGVYVAEDANLDHAVETLVDGAFFNSGQSCCGTERVYVHESIHDAFVEKALALTQQYQLGDPSDSNTSMGPLVNARSSEPMTQQIQEAKAKGANIIIGGKTREISGGTFLEPTVLTNVNHEMEIMKEENFGPILPIMKVSSLEEAITAINDSAYGLTSAIFTQDEKKVQKFANEVQAGTIFQNRCDYLDPALPWTGFKHSGCGSALSKYGYYSVTQRKGEHFRLGV